MATAADTFYANDEVKLHSRVNPNRELTRYVFCAGDHIEARDKRNLDAPLGGIWVGHSEVEGAPTMKKTKYMLHTLGITPLETTALPKKADHRAEKSSEENYLTGRNVPPGTRGYSVYAGDTLNYLQSDRFKPLGVVELSAMMGFNWGDPIQKIQLFFFPDFYAWVNKEKPIPQFLDDRVALIQEGLDKAQEEFFRITGREMLESARLFRTFAHSHIERNRQMIQSMRNVNMGGMYIGWTEKSRLYANQLNLKLESEETIRDSAKAASGDSTAVIKEMAKDRELILKQMELQKQTNDMILGLILSGNSPSPETIKDMLSSTQVPPLSDVDQLKQEIDNFQEVELPNEGEFDATLHDVSLGTEREEVVPVEEVQEELREEALESEEPTLTPTPKEFKQPEMEFDGQCHGIRKKTQDRCQIQVYNGELFCHTHSKE